MTDETILWPAMRTRVIPIMQYQNPWFRTGSQAREQRAFLRAIAPAVDRQEEDEDYDTWAPPRPTRSFIHREEQPHLRVDCSGWEDSEQKHWDDEQREIARQKRHEEDLRRIDERRRWLKQPWTYDLDSLELFDQAEAMEAVIVRQDGHWYTPSKLYWELGGRYLRTNIVAWYAQHGEITNKTVLRRTCDQHTCISPHHHEEV